MTKLFKVYIGLDSDRDGKQLFDTYENSQILDNFLESCAQRYGGFTLLHGRGGWINPQTGLLVTERVATVEIAITNDTATDLLGYVATIKRQYNQSEILVTETEITSITI